LDFKFDFFPVLQVLWQRLDKWMIQFMAHYSVLIMRISLAVVFIWFGLLKVTGYSPVVDLVAKTVYWFPPKIVIPVLGVWEIIVGYGLLFGVLLRLTLFLFWIQMAGTFLVLVLLPHVAFQIGNPFLLTMAGEFVIKNLVLIAAGLVIGSTVRKDKKNGTT